MRRGLIWLWLLFGLPFISFSEVTTLNLDQAIEFALDKNLEIKQLESALDVAEAKKGQAFGDFIMPDISLSGDFTYLDSKTVDSSGLTMDFSALADPINSAVGSNILPSYISNDASLYRDNYGVDLTISKAIFAGFALYDSYTMQEKNLELAKKTLEDKKKDLQFTVTEDFYYLFLLKENVDLMIEYDEQLAATVDFMEENYDAGYVSRYDLVQAEVNYLNNKPTLRSISNAYEIAKMTFLTTIGFENGEEIEIMGSLWDATNYPAPDMEREVFLELAYSNDIDLLTLENALSILDETRDMAESSRYPTLSAFFTYGLDYEKNTYEQINADRIWEGSWSTGLQLNVPIDDWIPISSTAQSIKEVDATIEQTKYTVEQYKQAIKISVNTYFMQLEEAEASVNAQKASVDSAELALELANKKFRAGTISSLDLSSSEVSYQDAWASYLEAVYNYVSAVLNLNKLIGNTDILSNESEE